MRKVKDAWQNYQLAMKEYEQKYSVADPALNRFKKEIVTLQNLNLDNAVGFGLQTPRLVEDILRPAQAKREIAGNNQQQQENAINGLNNEWTPIPSTTARPQRANPVGTLQQTLVTRVPSLARKKQEKGILGPGYSFNLFPREVEEQLKRAKRKNKENAFLQQKQRSNSRKDAPAPASEELDDDDDHDDDHGEDKVDDAAAVETSPTVTTDPFDVKLPKSDSSIDLKKYEKILTPLLFGGLHPSSQHGGRTRRKRRRRRRQT